MTAREKIAAFLLDRDERPGDSMAWAEQFIDKCKDDEHNGDCPHAKHKGPITCNRCVADGALADADKIIALVSEN